jgi:hypothetical protein
MDYWTVVSHGRGPPIAIVDVLGRIALVIGFMLIVFAVIVFQFLKVRELYASGDSATPDEQANCSSCGARISADADTCNYCSESIER